HGRTSEALEKPGRQTEFLAQLGDGLAIRLEYARAPEPSKAAERVAASHPLSQGTGGECTEQLAARRTPGQIVKNIGVDEFIRPLQLRGGAEEHGLLLERG